jgi:hypothetical protein
VTGETSSGQGVDLRGIRVIALERATWPRWDELIVRHHYLGTRGMVGEHLRQVAVDAAGRWLALLGWTTAAFKCGVRDRWIGWLPSQQWRRLPVVANNARFLVLPEARVPHLASRVLGLAVRDLDAQWRRRHGHGLLLAETFVDGARFQGTCYRAAGWQVLGQTRGFARRAGCYVAHGQPKLVLVKPLHARARELLCAAQPPTAFLPQETHMDPLALRLTGPGSLKEALSQVSDPRGACGKEHRDFAGLLTLIAMAHLAGMRSSQAIADYVANVPQDILRACGCRVDLRPYRVRAPSEPTLRRIIARVSAEQLDEIVSAWLASQGCWSDEDAIAIDGKTLRGSHIDGENRVELVAACSHATGAVIAQAAVETQAGEMETALHLIERLPQDQVRGRMFTLDALHTQHRTCAAIAEKGATSS